MADTNRTIPISRRLARIWGAALTTVLLLSSAVPTARAAPVGDLPLDLDIIRTGYFLYIVPSTGPLEVCVGGQAEILIMVKKVERRYFTHIWPEDEITRTPLPEIHVFSMGNSQPEVGSTTEDGAPTGVDGSHARLVFKGLKKGKTTLEFKAFIATPTGVREAAEELEVEVKECAYELTVKSTWQFPKGWKPKAEAYLVTKITPDEDGNFDLLAPVSNSMYWTVPVPLCGHPGNVGPTKARVKGSVTDGNMAFSIQYDESNELQKFICLYIGTAAARPDTGTPKSLRPQEIRITGRAPEPGEGIVSSLPHILIASPTVQGTAVIELEAIGQ